MSEFKTLINDQVDEIVLLSSNTPYKNGERAKNKETYSSFRYEGIVFTVPDSSPFVKDFIDEKVLNIKLRDYKRTKKIKLSDGTESEEQVRAIEFDSHGTFTKAFNRERHQSRMAQLKVIGNSTSLSEAQILMLENDNI